MEDSAFIYLSFLRKTLLALPHVTEQLLHGTPAFYVGKKIIARLWDDAETLVIGTLEREKWITTQPDVYYITDHYQNYAYMLVRLKNADPQQLEALLIVAWRNRAPKKAIKQYEDNEPGIGTIVA